jgi:hypothetical protein
MEGKCLLTLEKGLGWGARPLQQEVRHNKAYRLLGRGRTLQALFLRTQESYIEKRPFQSG